MALWRNIDTLGVELCLYIIIEFHSNIVSTCNHIIQAGGAACESESTEARQGLTFSCHVLSFVMATYLVENHKNSSDVSNSLSD